MAAIFGALGLAALFSALFFGATHQLFMATIGFGMAIALISDNEKNMSHGK